MSLAVAFCLLVLSSSRYAEASQRPLTCSSLGTFKDPSVLVRPKFRYWLPDASINSSILERDITELGSIGAGGIELLNYFNYGGIHGPPPKEVDWNVYGYATPAYRQILETALQASKNKGLIMDFSMGPQSGQGVPAEPHDVGLSWELITFNESFSGEYHGQLPGWGSGDFISASTFQIVENNVVPALMKPAANKTEFTISETSLVDLTHLVDHNGTITIKLQSQEKTVLKTLFTTYARRSYTRASIATSPSPVNIVQNGTFAVDHFSRHGAKLTTSFLEKYIVQPNSTIKALFEEIGRYIWEDSPEIPTPIYWTPNLPQVFRQKHGYDVRKYIPLLTGFNGDLMLNDPQISIVTDGTKDSNYLGDFRTTLTELYQEYLETLRDWAHSYLGIQFSAQVGYNLPVDMLSSIPSVDAPETETLAFLNNVDAFRQFSGPASLQGDKIVSIELGADYGQAYSQSLALLIEEASRAYSAGINQVVIHGASYSGDYPQTTYPGFTTFGYNFGGQHSRHQPAWDIDYRPSMDWLARAQFVLQSGIPRVDLVFWNKQTAQDPFPSSLYLPTDLSDAGYTYTYLSPDNFASEMAVVEDGIFAPDTLAAKAVILRQNDTLTPLGVEKLATYAKLGLNIIVQGDYPSKYSTSNESAISAANLMLQTLLSLPNVHRINLDNSTSSDMAATLKALNILPRTSVKASGTWYTRYISASDSSFTSIFIFSDSDTVSEGLLNITSTGIPYMLDLWNGVELPILKYRRDEKSGIMSIPVKMAAKQAIVIQVKNSTYASPQALQSRVFVTEASDDVVGFGCGPSEDSIAIQIGPATLNASDANTTITKSDGNIVSLRSSELSVPDSFNLSEWILTAEKWLPPQNLNEINGVVKESLTVQLEGSQIPPWPYIKGLSNSSGIGVYTTTFDWPPPSVSRNLSDIGAYLVLPPTKLVQGISISLNNQDVPSVDIFRPTIDIGTYLLHGPNVLKIRISTTLWNSLRPIWRDLRTGGDKPEIDMETLLASPQTASLGMELPLGLAGSVQVVPYVVKVV